MRMMRRCLHRCAVTLAARHNINLWGRNDSVNRRKEACHCKNVTYGMIEDAVRSGADTLQAVMDATGAGKGCGKCKDFLVYLIRDIREEMDKETNHAVQ